MRLIDFIPLVVGFVALCAESSAQPLPPANSGERTYIVFLKSRAIGQEKVLILERDHEWLIRGSNSLGPPLDVVTRTAEIAYDSQWRPTRLLLEGTARGQALIVKTAFAGGQATSELSLAGVQSTKTDAVAADAVVLPNGFLGSYAALARRLVGQKAGSTLRGYIAPQGEVPIRIDGVIAERVETPRESIAATRYALVVTNPPPAGEMPMSVWVDAGGALLRMSIPAQTLELARDDVASAATRTTSFSVPGDESVRIPAAGFNLAGSIARPANAKGPLPALILVGGSGPTDRDGVVAGIPVLGQIAADLVDAGFLVVRYDKRGLGQSGGRTETATIADYAEDVRAVITWLEKTRKDVDQKRIGLVGHSEGAWVAMAAAARDKRVAAIALIAGVGTRGGELILEQQRHLLAQTDSSETEKQQKIELQKRVNDAALKGGGWEGIPDQIRSAADTPWFHSFLAFDPARVMRDVRQPVLVVQGELDTQVAPHHADRLADLARARKRKVAVDVAKVPGVNHLLVPAKTGNVSEYPTLPDKEVSPIATAAIASWMAKNL
jgi:pimeloyl-ACP methyl ester carboxylesterase